MAHAGPSNPPKSKKKQRENAIRSSKVKKVAEVKSVEALEEAASQYEAPPDLKAFSSLPISSFSQRGLKKVSFVEMTDIQVKSLPVSLKGKDVLGAARTGSGKTLAFLIPVLEILYRRKWGPQDGLGALIISPTRELAVQIFEVLRSIGGFHSFSAGIIIGGKNIKDEQERLSRMNILVATPGRLLQHMDQTIGFECDNLQILDLARLSLKDPVYISTQDADAEGAMPKGLEQQYIVCTLDKKLDVLFSFIKTHLQNKTLVFMSSCKQVRFVFETFCKMHPGVPLLHLHGKQKQMTRLTTFQKYTSMKHAVLLATDIAARGLDFPSVDWVLQVDAPEDADTYIHRVGRTARYESAGKGLLFLLPSEEEGMKAALEKKGIVIAKTKIKASKTQSIENQLQKLAFEDPEIKYLGQRAFVSYLRSIHVHKDKSVFKLEELPVERFAESLVQPSAGTNVVNSEESEAEEDDLSEHSSSEEEEIQTAESKSEKPKVRTKYDRMFERKNQNILSEHFNKLVDHEGDKPEGDDSDDDFITLKRADHELDAGNLSDQDFISKRKEKMAGSKKAIAKYGSKGTKLIFDDEGKPHQMYEMKSTEDVFKNKDDVKEAGRKFAESERSRLKEADVMDKSEAKEKRKEKKRKRKEREREEEAGGTDDKYGVATLASVDDDGYASPDFELPSADEDEQGTPPPKRAKSNNSKGEKSNSSLARDEELALQLLRGKR
ncbi:hypothetical protein EW026_g2192 [Hermanssonia centrifuga]|uniref:ATP-dependent RNA helicase n=1 Tax=Hermanssonia centrifuga TaxID=98765 RepID=A0A4S4KPY9_9APHY|nr:hypothetical protein EW026_g2192 [Hermanssonia centrifuga]